MGKSGYLPDISYNFGFYRTLAVNSVQKKDWIGAESGLYNLNGCLGDEYLVAISTKKYEEIMSDKAVYQCGSCTTEISEKVVDDEDNETTVKRKIPTEIPRAIINIIDIVIPIIDQVIQKCATMRIWICPECKAENQIEKTVQIVPETQKPYCIGVVPNSPHKELGIANRLGFKEVFDKWFWNFLEEINWKEVAYRKEYMAQNDGQDMEVYKDKGDSITE